MKALWIGMIACGLCLAQSSPNPEEFKGVIQAHLDKERPACVALFDQRDPNGHILIKGTESMVAGSKVEQYRLHGLLIRQETHVDVPNAMVLPVSRLFWKYKNAWRYEWTPAVSGDVVDDQLCYGYGRKLAQVVRWTDPRKSGPVTVEYSWGYGRVADWAKQAWIETGDPEVWSATKPVQTSTISLTLFNDGWH